MDETDDAAHLQSMLEDFSDGELVEDLLPQPPSSKLEGIGSTVVVNQPRQNEVAIFVGNLAAEITEKLLETIFSEFGPIRTIDIIQSSEKNRYAFITYYDHADANAARFTMNGKHYLGTKLVVQWRRRHEGYIAEEQNSTIWVGDLDKEVTNNDLREAFAPFGEIVTCHIVTDNETSESKGFGFVTYGNCEDAEMAIETMQGQWIKSKIIQISWARKINQRVREFERKNILFLKGAPRYESYIQCQQTFDTISNQTSMSNRTIFIGGVTSVMLNRDILNLVFSPFGCIEDIKLCNGQSTEKPGYAFIMYSTKESACNAIMCMHNKVPEGNNDNPLKVAWGKEKHGEAYEENYSEPQPPSFEFGRPFDDFQRTVQGYGYTPVPAVPTPLQFPNQKPVGPSIPNTPSETVGVAENTGQPTEEESGLHAFSYYGTYVYQEKNDTEEEETMSSSSSSSSNRSRRPIATIPSQLPPNPPAEPKPRLKSVAKMKTEEKKPSKTKKVEGRCTKRARSPSRNLSKKRKIDTRTRDGSHSRSSISRSRSRTRSRSRYRRSHGSSRSRSRSRSFSDRRSRPRSRSFGSGPESVRHRPVKSRDVRKKHKLPLVLPNHPLSNVPTFNHNIHAINQSTIVSFPGSSNYQQNYQPVPESIPQFNFHSVRPSFPTPISYGPPQPPTFLNPPLQQLPPALPQPHQCYVNPNFINHNQFPRINHQNQEYNQSYTVPVQHNPNFPNIPPNFAYQHQVQFNEPNANYGYGNQYHPSLYDNNYYYHLPPGPRINNNTTYFPPK